MIEISKQEVFGWEAAIRGMRNPMNSWAKSDSGIGCDSNQCSKCGFKPDWCGNTPKQIIGPNDVDLMLRLAKAGSVDGKFRRMIVVYVDITAPLYWWKEFDTYKVGTVANSCSTMHKIHDKEFTPADFSHEHLLLENSDGQFILNGTDIKIGGINLLYLTVKVLNGYRNAYIKENDPKIKKLYWWQMIQLLPSSYNQKRTVMLNYEVLSNIYQHRHNHKLDEWRELCKWIETLPYSEIITLKQTVKNEV